MWGIAVLASVIGGLVGVSTAVGDEPNGPVVSAVDASNLPKPSGDLTSLESTLQRVVADTLVVAVRVDGREFVIGRGVEPDQLCLLAPARGEGASTAVCGARSDLAERGTILFEETSTDGSHIVAGIVPDGTEVFVSNEGARLENNVFVADLGPGDETVSVVTPAETFQIQLPSSIEAKAAESPEVSADAGSTELRPANPPQRPSND